MVLQTVGFDFDFVSLLFQGACVENVLDSVVESLRRDSNRKFIFAEMVMKKGIFCLFDFSFFSFVILDS